MTPPPHCGVVLVWQVLSPLLLTSPCSVKHALEFPVSFEKLLHGCLSMLAFLQDRKPVIMPNLLLISEPAGEVLLPIASTPSWLVHSLVAAIPLFFIKGPVPQLPLPYPFLP